MDYKILFGIIAICLSLSGYVFYFRSLFAGKTKPHAFSWLIWGVVSFIGFAVQVLEHAGPGAWANGFSAFGCFTVFIIALRRGERNITKGDWISLTAAGISLLLWYLTKDPLFTVILITLIELFGFFPTVRKSYHKPNEENAILYFMCGLAYACTLIAMKTYIIATVLYPTALVFLNWSFTIMLFWRRVKS